MKTLMTLITLLARMTWRMINHVGLIQTLILQDLEAAQQNSGQQKTTSQGNKTFSWRKKHFETPECTFTGPSVTPPDNLLTPLKYFFFRKFIKAEIIELLKEQTNLYNVQTSGPQKNVNTTVKEMAILIGIYLRMGLQQMPGNRAYWENDTRCPLVDDNMSRNRSQTLLACLHFTDNNDS